MEFVSTHPELFFVDIAFFRMVNYSRTLDLHFFANT